ncbi:hypothetical protein B0H17DRAFT_1216945 [Mycena rosella]|uniref:Uncharacterized protein n=1 Tax=Mycena rosella TaxID=1033263 RepID=A0AAD7FQT8_MYCRO|nr:hypothetical protein B0H17DRAFT_1216945 [Mycena rosella]
MCALAHLNCRPYLVLREGSPLRHESSRLSSRLISRRRPRSVRRLPAGTTRSSAPTPTTVGRRSALTRSVPDVHFSVVFPLQDSDVLTGVCRTARPPRMGRYVRFCCVYITASFLSAPLPLPLGHFACVLQGLVPQRMRGRCAALNSPVADRSRVPSAVKSIALRALNFALPGFLLVVPACVPMCAPSCTVCASVAAWFLL